MTDKQAMTEFICTNCYYGIRVTTYKALSLDEAKALNASKFYRCCDNPDYSLRYTSGVVRKRETTVQDVENIRELIREGYSADFS